MVVKKTFTLLKDVDNVLSLSSSVIRKQSVMNGQEKVFALLDLIKSQINHYTKDKVFSLFEKKGSLQVLTLADYPLPVSVDLSKGIIVNISPFGVKDILPAVPGPKNLYACLVYGTCLQGMIKGKVKVDERYAQPMVDFLTSMFVRLFLCSSINSSVILGQ